MSGIRMAGIGLAVVAVLGAGSAWVAAAADGRAKLAEDLAARLAGSFKGTVIPATDQKRTEKCLAEAMVADIPEADAETLAAIYAKQGPGDPALVKRWLSVDKKLDPARNAQVMGQVKKLCPDLEPYLERVL